jgi:hypothetical protein
MMVVAFRARPRRWLAGWLACDRREELADQRWNELTLTTLHYDQIRSVFFVNIFILLI